MKSIHFDHNSDIAPIPFDEGICRLGARLKEKGLRWHPHVGCFVWDPDGVIRAPSPFPNRIYFILSMPKFLDIFGTVERMIEKLVWLPTWHQALILCRGLGLRENAPATDLHEIYQRIAASIDMKDQSKSFCDQAIKTELGDTSDLPTELASHVRLVFEQFVSAYLDMLRQKNQKTADWFPDRWSLDLGLVDDMRHFFSDHQFITRKFILLNTGIRRLRKIDRVKQPNQYQDAVDELLQKPDRNILAEIGFEKVDR